MQKTTFEQATKLAALGSGDPRDPLTTASCIAKRVEATPRLVVLDALASAVKRFKYIEAMSHGSARVVAQLGRDEVIQALASNGCPVDERDTEQCLTDLKSQLRAALSDGVLGVGRFVFAGDPHVTPSPEALEQYRQTLVAAVLGVIGKAEHDAEPQASDTPWRVEHHDDVTLIVDAHGNSIAASTTALIATYADRIVSAINRSDCPVHGMGAPAVPTEKEK